MRGAEGHDGAVVLGFDLVGDGDPAAIGFGLGGAAVEDGAFNTDGIAGADGGGPAHFVHAGRAHRGGVDDFFLIDQAKSNAKGVETTGDNAAERAFLRGDLVDMDRLRVVLPGKVQDLCLA